MTSCYIYLFYSPPCRILVDMNVYVCLETDLCYSTGSVQLDEGWLSEEEEEDDCDFYGALSESMRVWY